MPLYERYIIALANSFILESLSPKVLMSKYKINRDIADKILSISQKHGEFLAKSHNHGDLNLDNKESIDNHIKQLELHDQNSKYKEFPGHKNSHEYDSIHHLKSDNDKMIGFEPEHRIKALEKGQEKLWWQNKTRPAIENWLSLNCGFR